MAHRHLERSLHRLRQNRFLKSPDVRSLIFWANRLLKHHLSDFVQVDLFDAQDAENEFAWHFDTLKYRFIDITSLFSIRSESRLLVLRAIDYIKHYLSHIVQFAYFDAGYPENEFAWHSDTLKHRFNDFTKVVI
jgi:hypothetical protein